MKHLVKKICPVCGKEFEGSTKSKYCSYGCKAKASNDRNKAYRAEYYQKNREKYLEYQRAKNNIVPEKVEITCPVCGKVFIGDARQKYCSDECLGAAYRQTQRDYHTKNATVYTKTCEICGKEFTTTYSEARCCSDECKVEHNRQRQKKYNSQPHRKRIHSEETIKYQQKVKELGMPMREFKKFVASGADVDAYLEQRRIEATRICTTCGSEFISYNKRHGTQTCPACREARKQNQSA